MPQRTSIEWADRTWNPVAGCTKVSPGCDNCYAERITKRFGRDFTRISLHPERLDAPLKWREPSYVFVNSMSDLFHSEAVPFEFVARVFDVMAQAEHHVFQILTKRPQRMKHYPGEWPANVWAGTSVESPAYSWRIDQLREVPAEIRFVSFEPLIERISDANLQDINWAIVGGESGPGCRPLEEDWVLRLRDICAGAGTDFFFKQWGGPTAKSGGRLLEGRTWDARPVLAVPAMP